MKIKSLYIEKFKGLKDFYIEFDDKVTVLIGENGSGKTTVLEVIYNMLGPNAPKSDFPDTSFFAEDESFKGCTLVVDVESEWERGLIYEKYVTDRLRQKKEIELRIFRDERKRFSGEGDWSILNYIKAWNRSMKFEELPHIAYSPTEVNFKKYKANTVKKPNDFVGFKVLYDLDNMSIGLKDFLIYQHHRDLEDFKKKKDATRIERYKKFFNSFYENKEFIDVEDLEFLFRVKSTGEVHSVDDLSSGEKQIFFRAGAILQHEFNNSVILLDEPEMSMHPEWQQKILDFYRDVVGENNQLIIATHSPHIVSSCKREEVRVLAREEETGNIKVREDFEQTYGWTVEQLLLTVFGMQSVRNPEVQKDLDRFKQLYINKQNLSNEEKDAMEELKKKLYSYLDASDPELSLVGIDETTKKLENLLKSLKGS